MGHNASWLERNAENLINVFQSDPTSELISGSRLEFLMRSSTYATTLVFLRGLILNKVLLPFYIVISFLFFLSLIFVADTSFNIFNSIAEKHSVFGVLTVVSLFAFSIYLLA